MTRSRDGKIIYEDGDEIILTSPPLGAGGVVVFPRMKLPCKALVIDSWNAQGNRFTTIKVYQRGAYRSERCVDTDSLRETSDFISL